MVDVSVILINYNTKYLCRQAIQSLRETTHWVRYEIVVVDNSTISEERFLGEDNGIILLVGVENRGFGNACNLGAGLANGRYLLFLNTDTILHDGALDNAVLYLEAHEGIGALGIRTLLENGEFDHGCKRGFPTPMRALYYFMKLDRLWPCSKRFGGYRLTYLDPGETNEVDAVSGSFLMTPKAVFDLIGGFDETFFMYGEDLDLCYRIKQAGYAVVYYAQASMVHLKGQSGLHTRSMQVQYHFYNAMRLFYDKHYKEMYPPIVGVLVHIAIDLKYRAVVCMSKRKKNRV